MAGPRAPWSRPPYGPTDPPGGSQRAGNPESRLERQPPRSGRGITFFAVGVGPNRGSRKQGVGPEGKGWVEVSGKRLRTRRTQAPAHPAPLQGYHEYIDENLPPESPYLYGLHPNAEIGFLTVTSEKLFRTVLEMQPKETDSGAGTGVSREEKVGV